MYGGFENLETGTGKKLFKTLGVAGNFALTDIEIKKFGNTNITEFTFSNEQGQYVKKVINHGNNYLNYAIETNIEKERKSKAAQILEIIMAQLPLAREEASKIHSSDFEEYMMLMSTFLKRQLSEKEKTEYICYIAVTTNKKGNFPEIPSRTGTIGVNQTMVYIQDWEKQNRFTWKEDDKPVEEQAKPIENKDKDDMPF